MKKRLSILGTRGIPAQHGGFETFAEHFSLFLLKKGWEITVYCQSEVVDFATDDMWQGVHRIHIPVTQHGALGTIVFDWKSTSHAAKKDGIILTLGYNTAFFCIIYRLRGLINLINMDGIEWRRDKWSFCERAWLYFNEKLGGWLGNHLVADHPEIKKHLAHFVSPDKITVIPYSAPKVTSADNSCLQRFGISPGNYAILIARPEPENSILQIVKAFAQLNLDFKLVILGNYASSCNVYHKQVLDSANSKILFVGAIYEQETVQSLRFHARFYIHGHTVGGTNPSLVEALGAGSAVLAHDNRFNRWVAGESALYFSNVDECATRMSQLFNDDNLIASLKEESRSQYQKHFTAEKVYGAYENLLLKYVK